MCTAPGEGMAAPAPAASSRTRDRHRIYERRRPVAETPAEPWQRRGIGFAAAFKNIGFSFGAPERCFASVELRGGGDIEQVIVDGRSYEKTARIEVESDGRTATHTYVRGLGQVMVEYDDGTADIREFGQ